MKIGIELISKEREEQLSKHHIAVIDDAMYNKGYQLSFAAAALSCPFPESMGLSSENQYGCPSGWDAKIWCKMIHKPYKDRLVVAGALLAAEIDRLQLSE